MKICPNCKQENQDQAAFCNFCGKPLIILRTQPAHGAWTTKKERYISPWISGIVIMCGSIGIGIMLDDRPLGEEALRERAYMLEDAVMNELCEVIEFEDEDLGSEVGEVPIGASREINTEAGVYT